MFNEFARWEYRLQSGMAMARGTATGKVPRTHVWGTFAG
jgi:hypothetical protein